MSQTDDEKTPADPGGRPPPDKVVSGSSQAREARLAAALRANLRRRKSGPKGGD